MIEIIDRSNGGKVTRFATPINDYLCLVALEQGYVIYKTIVGKPLTNIFWKTKELGIHIANQIAHIYEEYLPLWETPGWEQADIFSLCRYSVPNGERIYLAFQKLQGQVVNSLGEIK